MKKYVKSSDNLAHELQQYVGKDVWLQTEVALPDSEEDNGIRGGWWLYYLKMLSVSADGECVVNYYNYDFPEQFSSLDQRATTCIEDIDFWGEVVTTAELKEIIKRREAEHDQELADYYGEDYDDEDDDDEDYDED